MPNMDGITLVRKVREKDKKSLIIMATTESDKARVLAAIGAGVNNYVVKPFTPEALMEKVTQTLAKAKAAA
jgi:two-component system chemotaxis response regulator CheY